jgi:hypothetical protein
LTDSLFLASLPKQQLNFAKRSTLISVKQPAKSCGFVSFSVGAGNDAFGQVKSRARLKPGE